MKSRKKRPNKATTNERSGDVLHLNLLRSQRTRKEERRILKHVQVSYNKHKFSHFYYMKMQSFTRATNISWFMSKSKYNQDHAYSDSVGKVYSADPYNYLT